MRWIYILPVLLACSSSETPIPQVPQSSDDLVPVLRPNQDADLPVVLLEEHSQLHVAYEQRPASNGGGELAAVTWISVTMTGGLSWSFPAAALQADTALDAAHLDAEAFGEYLSQGFFTLNVPGAVTSSVFEDQTVLLVAARLGLDGRTEFDGVGLSLAIPSNALPSSGLPVGALPANALPANALPSNAIPANALPSSLLGADHMTVAALPANALPANALPSSWWLRQDEPSADGPILAYLLTCRDQEGTSFRATCSADTDLAAVSTEGLTVSCPIKGVLEGPDCTLAVLVTLRDAYLYATLDGIPLLLLKSGLDLGANRAPAITMAERLRVAPGRTSNIDLSVEDPDEDLLLGSLSGAPSWLRQEHHRLTFTPPAEVAGETASFTARVEDNGNPRRNAELLVTVEVAAEVSGDPPVVPEPSDDGEAPEPIGDTAAPTSPVMAFVAGATGQGLIQAIHLGAKDDHGVSAYCLQESDTTPAPGAACFVAVPETPALDVTADHSFTEYGPKLLWVWYRDLAGNISASASAAIELSAPETDNAWVDLPGGTFFMGAQSSNTGGDGYDPDALPDETPVHSVTLAPFRIQRYEVTAREYADCVTAGFCLYHGSLTDATHTYGDSAKLDHPINQVDWHEAWRYCVWLDATLPTEAQWEYAAKGTTGMPYPWGNTPPSSTNPDRANCAREVCDDQFPYTAPVDAFPGGTTPTGLHGLAGNVWEWTADRYGRYSADDQTDPTGPTTGTHRVVRGGSFTFDNPVYLRTTNRFVQLPDERGPEVGFRCAAPVQ
ncbi:MAG: hypothetical protein A2284_12875 [Deltaproteobacteria bacterium RIFOXYA12_FULL_61_11]|nr:MAG: hypothetical protein A2284_12875 [Deltaproteobacteria bacterium RIFOXYA12_FULL_61_11]